MGAANNAQRVCLYGRCKTPFPAQSRKSCKVKPGQRAKAGTQAPANPQGRKARPHKSSAASDGRDRAQPGVIGAAPSPATAEAGAAHKASARGPAVKVKTERAAARVKPEPTVQPQQETASRSFTVNSGQRAKAAAGPQAPATPTGPKARPREAGAASDGRDSDSDSDSATVDAKRRRVKTPLSKPLRPRRAFRTVPKCHRGPLEWQAAPTEVRSPSPSWAAAATLARLAHLHLSPLASMPRRAASCPVGVRSRLSAQRSIRRTTVEAAQLAVARYTTS